MLFLDLEAVKNLFFFLTKLLLLNLDLSEREELFRLAVFSLSFDLLPLTLRWLSLPKLLFLDVLRLLLLLLLLEDLLPCLLFLLFLLLPDLLLFLLRLLLRLRFDTDDFIRYLPPLESTRRPFMTLWPVLGSILNLWIFLDRALFRWYSFSRVLNWRVGFLEDT